MKLRISIIIPGVILVFLLETLFVPPWYVNLLLLVVSGLGIFFTRHRPVTARLQLLVILLIATTTVKGETVRLEDERLTFTLPPGWVAIPEPEMAQRNAEVQQSLAKPYTFNFKYGYQKQGTDWFSYPFILIKQQDTKRIPESELRKLPTIDLSPAEDQVRELAPRHLDNMSLDSFRTILPQERSGRNRKLIVTGSTCVDFS